VAGTDAFLGKIEGERNARPLPFKSIWGDGEREFQRIGCEGEGKWDVFLRLGCEGPGTEGGEFRMVTNGDGERDTSDVGLGSGHTAGSWPLARQPPRRRQCLRHVLLSQRECAFLLHARAVHISSRVVSLNRTGCNTGEAPSVGEPDTLLDPDDHRKNEHACSPENFRHYSQGMSQLHVYK
jgi:hypothetical protein